MTSDFAIGDEIIVEATGEKGKVIDIQMRHNPYLYFILITDRGEKFTAWFFAADLMRPDEVF